MWLPIGIALLSSAACVRRVATPLEKLPESSREVARRIAKPSYGGPAGPARAAPLADQLLSLVPEASRARVHHEPALDGVAQLVGHVWLAEQRDLADPVVEQLVWHAGVAAELVGYTRAVSEGDTSADEFFRQHLTGIVWPSEQPAVFGASRVVSGAYAVQVVVIAARAVALAATPKTAEPGGRLVVEGRLELPADDVEVLVEDTPTELLRVPVTPEKDGHFRVEVELPEVPARRLVELTGEAVQGWRSTLAIFPVWAGEPVPDVPEVALASETPNPPVDTWESVVRERLNALRARKGAPALRPHPATDVLAHRQAEAFARDRASPAANLYAELGKAGLRTRDAVELRGTTVNLSARLDRALARPSVRVRMLSPAYTKLSTAFVPMAGGGYADTFILSEAPGRFDAASVASQLRRALDRRRQSEGMTPFETTAALDVLAQAYAERTCRADAQADAFLNEEARRISGVRLTASQVITAEVMLPATLREALADNAVAATLLSVHTHAGIGACEEGRPGEPGNEHVVFLLGDGAK